MDNNDTKTSDKLFTFILNKLSELHPNISKELTKRLKAQKGLTKHERKKLKILILFREKKLIFNELSSMLNIEYKDHFDNPYSATSFDFTENIYGFMNLVSGSYNSKYEKSFENERDVF